MADYLNPPVIPRLDETELRRFVLGMVDGQIFSTAHMRGHDMNVLGVVFIPLIGDVFYPKAGEDVPPEPVAPTPPQDPVFKEVPEPPREPCYPEAPGDAEPDPDHIANLEFGIRWNRKQPSCLQEYEEQIALFNIEQAAKHEAKVAEIRGKWEEDLEAHKEALHKVNLENQAIADAHEVTVKEFQVTNATALKEREEWEALCERWRLDKLDQLGVIYEWMSKAGPRAINGMPTFFSCRLMHKEDWERARQAIAREQERRENIEV